jgi:hypothetical protein
MSGSSTGGRGNENPITTNKVISDEVDKIYRKKKEREEREKARKSLKEQPEGKQPKKKSSVSYDLQNVGVGINRHSLAVLSHDYPVQGLFLCSLNCVWPIC